MSASVPTGPMHPMDRKVVLTRSFDAPRRLLFEVWTDPKHLAQWWGPHGFTTPVCEVDPRVGGALRIVMRGPDGTDYPMSATFLAFAPPEGLAFVATPEDEAGLTLFIVMTEATFAEHDGRTVVTVSARVVQATDRAARMIDGMEAGWGQSLERLGAYVAKLAG